MKMVNDKGLKSIEKQIKKIIKPEHLKYLAVWISETKETIESKADEDSTLECEISKDLTKSKKIEFISLEDSDLDDSEKIKKQTKDKKVTIRITQSDFDYIKDNDLSISDMVRDLIGRVKK